ncbi:MAG TPA: nickel-responsive transcriptional regulator NikR [Alphaproteobacteria bacterium]|jgi:CopG family nickel-responsive transcriptional regulator|nr:nickel-responsive transcriptional regulator NikR [Alphaproteobacteria bacterium]
MQRVTISVSDEFAEELDRFMRENGYDNRSEALRDLARGGLDRAGTETAASGQCVASLLYVYDHGVREIPKKLAHAYHDHHDLSVATMHVHLDHDNCLEVAVLRGDSVVIRDFSRSVIAERGVRHGHVTFIPVEIEESAHAHGAAGHAHRHSHVYPKG